ncbi:ferredoxin [Streptomyces ferrugineus]|uniref:Ferredoxin n=1 Tax=Streptomyces ferrugineus TaxID=1413221 RepID=A0A7M2T0L2_9ACTN|nr:ferredoxin [Streptomyces ferrugineus]QOV41425.1 ferredoxin [Streptomyces ferrugineus]
MRLRVDRERCIGAGMCALTAPEVFDQDADDGRVLLLDAEPSAVHRAAARMAVGVCPSGAITFNEPQSGGP